MKILSFKKYLSIVLFIASFSVYAVSSKIPLTIQLDESQKGVRACPSKSLAVCTLQLPIGIPRNLTVRNDSTSATASNIQVSIPASSNITQDASQCIQLAPQSTCQIILTGHPPFTTYVVPVFGTNTAKVEIMLDVTA